MSPEELFRLQLELECKDVTSDDLLVRIPGPEPDSIHRFLITQDDSGYSGFVRFDVPRDIRERLRRLDLAQAFDHPDMVKRILSEYEPCNHVGRFKTYIFSDSLSSYDYPDAVRLKETHSSLVERYDPKSKFRERAVYALVLDGQIVSTCESSRENQKAAEAWVRTLPEYRRRGYARQVTAAWAHNLQQQEKVPFYSHKWDNPASQALAKSLGLIHVFSIVGYE